MKFSTLLFFTITSIGLMGCNQAGEYRNISGSINDEKTFGTGTETSQGALIKQERDENGDLRDCGIGSSAKKLGLPTCNQIVNRRESAKNKAEADASASRARAKKYSDDLITNKLSGSKLFTLANGSKIRIKTRVVYDDEFNTLIINAFIERVNSTAKVFENIFIRKTGYLTLNFVDADDFEFLDPLSIPLNIQKGMSQNIRYRKKMGTSTSDIVGMKVSARKPIRSLRQYNLISRIDVSFRP